MSFFRRAVAYGVWFLLLWPASWAFAEEPVSESSTPPTSEQSSSAPLSVPIPSLKSTPAERGAYLAKLSGCVSCHTAPSGKLMAGGRALETRYGTLFPPNLTLDRHEGLGRLGPSGFVHIMKRGRTPGGRALWPASNHAAFSRMSSEDLLDIYAYLETLEKVPVPVPSHQLKGLYRLPWVPSLIHFFSFKVGDYVYNSSQSSLWNRGAYLATAVLHLPCSATTCGSRAQAQSSDRLFAECAEQGYGESFWQEASVDQVAQALKTVFSSAQSVWGNSALSMTEGDLRALATYLRALKPRAPRQYADGQAVYQAHCAACHDDGLEGAPRLSDRKAWSSIWNLGMDEVLARVERGYNLHPPKGGCSDCRTRDLMAAMLYMAGETSDQDRTLWRIKAQSSQGK